MPTPAHAVYSKGPLMVGPQLMYIQWYDLAAAINTTRLAIATMLTLLVLLAIICRAIKPCQAISVLLTTSVLSTT